MASSSSAAPSPRAACGSSLALPSPRSSVLTMSEPGLATTAAELSALADAVERARDRVRQLAEPYLGSDREDVVVAIVEAERELRSAARALQRSLKVVRG